MSNIGKVLFVFILGVIIAGIGLALTELAVVLLGGMLAIISSLFLLVTVVASRQ